MKRKIIFIILVLLVLTNYSYIFANTKNKLNNRQNELDSKISQKEDEIDEKNSQISNSMKEVQKLILDISIYEQEISDLNIKISETTKRIELVEKDIKGKEQTLNEKQELLDKRLVALYESGNTSYIDLLLSSADLTDFISKYYLISELATIDTELINSIRVEKQGLEDLKIELQNNKTTLEYSKAEQIQKQNELTIAKREKETIVSDLTVEEKRLKKELEEFENEKKKIQEELEAIDRAENIKGNQMAVSSTSGKGYIFPVLSCTKSNISNLSYPSYSGHTGIDINKNVIGKSVVAVKDGTVDISRASYGSTPNYNSNGTYINSYSAYGEFVVLNHNDGSRTLYAHMKAGSRRVETGDMVKQGQVLGIVGNTGNVFPRPTSSSPFNGTHLHFEVRIGGGTQKNCVNPILYLP